MDDGDKVVGVRAVLLGGGLVPGRMITVAVGLDTLSRLAAVVNSDTSIDDRLWIRFIPQSSLTDLSPAHFKTDRSVKAVAC